MAEKGPRMNGFSLRLSHGKGVVARHFSSGGKLVKSQEGGSVGRGDYDLDDCVAENAEDSCSCRVMNALQSYLAKNNVRMVGCEA